MCGGAIIADLMSTSRSRRLTGDFPWPNLYGGKSKNSSSGSYSKPLRSEVVDIDNDDDDLEADLLEFKDYCNLEGFVDVKPFAFKASKPRFSKGWRLSQPETSLAGISELPHRYPGLSKL